jgi:hypothetical protein
MEPKPGDRVSLDVDFPGGRVVNKIGTLISVREGHAYIECDDGCYAGDAETLESDEPN